MIMKFLRRLFGRFKNKPKLRPTRYSFDSRTEKHLKSLLPEVEAEMRPFMAMARKVAVRFGMEVKAISGHRSPEEQAKLYAQGRTAPGKKVTNTLISRHNFGLALDLGLFTADGEYLDGKNGSLATRIYKIIANNAEADGMNIEAGLHWKSFPDPPHFEYKTPWTLTELRERSDQGLNIV